MSELEEPGAFVDSDFDPSVRWSFFNILPRQCVEALETIDPIIWDKSEEELEMMCNPTASMNRVRLAFQREYHKLKEYEREKLCWSTIAEASGVSGTKIGEMFTNPKKLIWMLTPIVEVHKQMEDIYYTTLTKLRKAVEVAPLLDHDGMLDSKTANFLMKVFSHLDKRQFGEFNQKIEIKDTTTPAKKEPKQVQEVDAEIEAIENRLKALGYGPGSEEVTEEDIERERLEDDQRGESQEGKRGIRVKAKKA